MKHLNAVETGPSLAHVAARDHWVALYRYLRTEADAREVNDLAQEVFTRLLKVSAKAIENPEAYVIQVASNVMASTYRRAKRQGCNVSLDSPEAEPLLQEFAPPSCESPEEQVGAEQLLNTLLSALPEDQRTALILHEKHGYSYLEIAHRLGTTARAIERRLLKARVGIRRLMHAIERQGRRATRSTTPGIWALRMLGGVVFSIIVNHFLADVINRVRPLVAQFRTASLPVEPAPQIICPSGDHKPLADHLSIHLQDHTTVEVNSDACLTVAFTAKMRRVKLDSGEAMFQVAPDPRRPFVVETGPISIQALGTQFDVYRRKGITRVAVNEGAVQISSRDGISRPNIKPLTILQQIVVPDDLAQPRVRSPITSSDFDQITAWRYGRIELRNQRLKEALEEFARYQHLQVEFDDPQIAEVHVNGVFHTTNVGVFLDLLNRKCINNAYDPVTGQVEFTSGQGTRAGSACQ